MFKNLLNTQKTQTVSIPIETDDKGYIDKQCPSENCEFLFKVSAEDWKNICKDEAIWCPMCGHAAPANQWFTLAQVEHAKEEAVAMFQGQINNAMRADARAFNSSQPRNAFIKMSMNVTGGHSRTVTLPAAATEAMELEIQCEHCSCRFSVIGSAYFCPACGRNSVERTFSDSLRKIRAKKDNIELVRAAFVAAGKKDEAELTCRSLLESCLQDGVTAFQKYCEELYRAVPNAAPAPFNAFQRLRQGSGLWQDAVGASYEDVLDPAQMSRLNILFQKRHLLAHRDGIVDDKYIKDSGDTTYKAGQRIVISTAELDALIESIAALATGLQARVKT